MVFLAVDEDGREWVYGDKPIRENKFIGGTWCLGKHNQDWYKGFLELPKGSIKKLIGRELTWEDEPVELKEK